MADEKKYGHLVASRAQHGASGHLPGVRGTQGGLADTGEVEPDGRPWPKRAAR